MHNSTSLSISYFSFISDAEFRVRNRVWREQPAGHDRGATLLPRGETQQHSAQSRAPSRHVVQVKNLFSKLQNYNYRSYKVRRDPVNAVKKLDHTLWQEKWIANLRCKNLIQWFQIPFEYWPRIWQRGWWILIPSLHHAVWTRGHFLDMLE